MGLRPWRGEAGDLALEVSLGGAFVTKVGEDGREVFGARKAGLAVGVGEWKWSTFSAMLFDQGAILGARGIDALFRLGAELGRCERGEIEASGRVTADNFPNGQRNLHLHTPRRRLKIAPIQSEPDVRGALEKLFVEAEFFAVNEGGVGGHGRAVVVRAYDEVSRFQ